MSTSPKPAVKLLNEVLHEMWGMETPEIRQEILADLEGWGASEREHVVEEKVKMTGELENRTAEDYQGVPYATVKSHDLNRPKGNQFCCAADPAFP